MTIFFLTLSTICLVLGIIPYLRDVVRQKTKPRIVSWFNWGLLTGIATAAAIQDGQYPSAVLTLTSTIAVFLVVFLGLKHGDRKFEAFDILCQAGAIAGLLCWIIFNSPLFAILITVTIDFIACLPTLKHAWQKPHEETTVAFVGGVGGGIFSLLAIENPQFSGLVYPVYLTFINIVLVGTLVFRAKRLALAKSRT